MSFSVSNIQVSLTPISKDHVRQDVTYDLTESDKKVYSVKRNILPSVHVKKASTTVTSAVKAVIHFSEQADHNIAKRNEAYRPALKTLKNVTPNAAPAPKPAPVVTASHLAKIVEQQKAQINALTIEINKLKALAQQDARERERLTSTIANLEGQVQTLVQLISSIINS